jgi:F-type H+-transporting ATPase subunit b
MLKFQLSTLLFQLVNFVLLLVILTRFFYRPLQRVMRQREDEVAACVRDAEERAKRADAERERLAAEYQRARAETEALLANARTEAAQTREQLLERARLEATRYLDQAKQRFQEQERAARQRLAVECGRAAVTMAGSLLREAAGPLFHQTLVEKLLAEGLHPDGDQQDLLSHAVARADNTITVEVAYPPSSDQEAQFRAILARTLGIPGTPLPLTFRTEPSLVAGVRILVGTVAVDFSLSRTLDELAQRATLGQEKN